MPQEGSVLRRTAGVSPLVGDVVRAALALAAPNTSRLTPAVRQHTYRRAAGLLTCVGLLLVTSLARGDEPADKEAPLEPLREAYRTDAAKCAFHHDAERKHPLQLVEKPVMRWANDDDWSGDVFVWTHEGRPNVIGCILSGPTQEGRRIMFHEFHLLAPQPIAPVDLPNRRHWQSKEGLAVQPIEGAPEPAKNASARLAQMRQISRDFSAHMEAEGAWELRLLPQPLFRYGDERSEVVDGGLFAYVWTKGTDPEVVLLLECRETKSGLAWHFAPVRFSNRSVWLRHDGKEVWRVESHREPGGTETTLPYTTAYARTFDAPSADEKESP